MTVVLVRNPIQLQDGVPVVISNRLYMRSESGKVGLAFPLAPRAITYDSFGQSWVETERSGTTPLLLRKGARLKTIQFSCLLTDVMNMFATQTSALVSLEALADTRERVIVRYGPQEAGLWRIDDVSYSSELRHPQTNEITRAMVSLTLKRANDAAPAVGPVTGGTKPAPAPPKPAPRRTYRVVKGDCLWRIAQRYYGKGSLWPRIYDANKGQIKNPHWIYPGQVFVIP